MSRERPLYAIVGPTAVGKTRTAYELARIINGEIISVDSRQVYRYLDVGTDKISPLERKIVLHHLIDVADPDEIFTAADFVKQSMDASRRIESRRKVPILAGGTPMYFKSLEGGMLSESLPHDESIRRELDRDAELRGAHALHDELNAIDPASAERIHPNDKARIVRALEIFKLSGCSATELYARHKKIGGERGIIYFGITAPREILFDRIERRVREQFHSGYPEEVRWLLDNGYSRDLPALRGFGYRELVDYIDGKITFDDAMAGDVQSTKAFSRRQMTWFRQFSPILWYDFSEITLERAVHDMAEKIHRSGG
ncbi:MAG: tRNA (adenosine(37)-N6)-dimethylallyltransferase MiaA [Synergistaceae bacterium]|jgi:tRNA dimethylallyltransferase|nr:tRNA (adenosine(37)-N6)-dimethylallyltransferase MiaA [Synergistaceae bacterium]